METPAPESPTVLTGTVEIAAPPQPKAGVKTSELWVKVIADVLTVAYASGWIPSSGIIATVVAIVATQLTAAGYAVLRTKAKAIPVTTGAIVGRTLTSLLFAGIVLAACSAGSTIRKDAAIGVVAAAGCELGNVSAQDRHDAGVWASDKVQSWIAGTTPGDLAGAEAAIAADLKRLEGPLLPCLIAGVIAGIAAPPNPSSGITSQALTAQASPDAAHTVAIAFRLAARQVGMPPLSTPAGLQ